MYSLFQSDRKNSDGDSEIQDPLKEAVKIIMGDTAIQQKLDEVAVEVSSKLNEVSQRTLQKLQEINPEIANNLNPVIPSTNNLKWVDVSLKMYQYQVMKIFLSIKEEAVLKDLSY